MRISDWSSDVCSSDLALMTQPAAKQVGDAACRRSCGPARATVRQVASRQPDRRQAGRATPAALAASVSLALDWGWAADLPAWGRVSAGCPKRVVGGKGVGGRVCEVVWSVVEKK